MTIPAKINRNTSHGLAVIAVRVLEDAHMTWVAAEVKSEHALRARERAQTGDVAYQASSSPGCHSFVESGT